MPLYLPRKVAAQPQGRARVDFANPLTKHMTFAWTASNGFQESVNGDVKNYETNGNLVVNGVRSSKGIVQNSSVNGAVGWGLRGRTVNNPQNQFTVGVAFQVRDLSADNDGIINVTNGSFYYSTVGIVSSKVQGATSNPNTTVASDTFVSVGDWIYAVYVLQNGNFQLYVNGVKQTAVGTGTLPIQTSPYNYVDFGPSRANILTAFVATRPWSQAEVTSWTNNPWQIFAPSTVTVVPQSTALPVLVVQSTPGTTALNGTAPDPTNVPGLNWFATSASFARLAGGGITNGGAGINTLSYLLPANRHKTSIGATSSLANGGQYVNLMCNASANNANLFSGSGYFLYLRGGGISTAQLYRTVGGSSTAVASFGPLISGVVDSAFLDCSVSGTLSASVTIGGTTYTSSYTDPSPLTGSYAGVNFGDTGGGTITIASVTLAASVASYSTRITWAEAQYQASGVPSVTDYSSPMSRGIFRGIERGVA